MKVGVSTNAEMEIDITFSGVFVPGCPAYGGSRFEPPINPPEPDDIEDLTIDRIEILVPVPLKSRKEGEPTYRAVNIFEGVDTNSKDIQQLIENILNAGDTMDVAIEKLIEEAGEID